MKQNTAELTIQAFGMLCASPGCKSRFTFPSGTIRDFVDAFDSAYHEGWLCLLESILDMTCPRCAAKTQRRLQTHQLMRNKLAEQPDWKRDIVISAWAAMTHIQDDEDLRDTDMPSWLRALLGKETTVKAAHVRHTLEHLNWNLGRYDTVPDAIQAARLAQGALDC